MEPLQKEYEHFLVLCENQNISRAAEQLGMLQGGLSKSLKRLEESLGGQLFIRKGRGLKITQLGLLLQEQLIQLKNDWTQGVVARRESLEDIGGVLRVGAHPTIVIDHLSSKLPRVVEKYKNLKIDLRLEASGSVTRNVIESEYDIGIVVNPMPHPDLVIVTLHQDIVGVYGRPIKERSEVVYYNPEMVNIQRVLKQYRGHKFVPIADYEVLASVATRSRGLCVLPSPVADRYKTLKLVSKKLFDVDLCLIYRADRPKTKTFLTILDELR